MTIIFLVTASLPFAELTIMRPCFLLLLPVRDLLTCPGALAGGVNLPESADGRPTRSRDRAGEALQARLCERAPERCAVGQSPAFRHVPKS